MPLEVSKDCFPTPTECHNCMRKTTKELKKGSDPKKEFKRCSSCHIMTYCDKDCQKEHWMKIHKKHCKFISGKVLVNGSKHNTDSCERCNEERKTSPTQLRSEYSPKSVCNIEEVIDAMKISLSFAFKFHREGKKCNCSLEYAFELPFPLGEVSGQYLEVTSIGLDVMLAHILRILTAMTIKAKKKEHKNAVDELWKRIGLERSKVWFDILVCGKPMIQNSQKYLCDQVDSLETIYGSSNPWCKSLQFSVGLAVNTNAYITSNFIDPQSLKDPGYQNLKLIYDYNQSQLQNQAIVCEKKSWANFLLWPEVVNGSLLVVLPSGTRCQTCYDDLRGDVAVSLHELNYDNLPSLLMDVGDNGILWASCSVAKKPNCWKVCLSKNVYLHMKSNEQKWKAYSKELEQLQIQGRQCDFCLKLSLSSHRCSACLTVQYCSTDCQKKDLDFHVSVCSTWAKDESRKILDKKKQKAYWKSTVGACGGK